MDVKGVQIDKCFRDGPKKELHDVVKPLSVALKTVNKADLSSPRKSAILYLIADANRLALAIALLVDGNNRGVPVGAQCIEVLTRTLIEDA